VDHDPVIHAVVRCYRPIVSTHPVELGRTTDFDRLPARVELVEAAYFLTRNGDEWRLQRREEMARRRHVR
jgi:hypothetical protein